MNPTPLSRRIASGASRKLLAEFSSGLGLSRGAGYGRPLARIVCLLLFMNDFR